MKDLMYKMNRNLFLLLAFWLGVFNVLATDYDEAINALGYRDQEKVLSVAEKLLTSDKKEDHIHAWYFMAKAYCFLGNDGKIRYPKAMHYAEKVISNTKRNNPLHMDAQLLSARIAVHRGHYMGALKSLLDLETADWTKQRPEHIFRIQTQLFHLYIELGDLESALPIYRNIDQLVDAFPSSVKLYNRKTLAYYHFVKGEYIEAKKYYTEALTHTANDPGDLVEVRHMLAEIEKEQGNYDVALRMYNDILSFEDSVHYEHGFIHTLLIATETTIMGNKEKVDIARYAFRAFQFAQQLQNKLRLAQTQVALGYYYLETKSYDSSLYYLGNACSLAAEIEAYYWQRSAARMLSQIYQGNKQYERALHYKQVQFDANAALSAQNHERVNQLLKNVHLIHRFHQENELSKQELKAQRYYMILWIIASVGAFIVAFLLLGMYVRQKRHTAFLIEKAIRDAKLKQQTTVTSRPSKSGIDDTVMEELKAKLEGFIQEKGYLDCECSLSTLAKQLETNTAYLSHLINDSFEVSFNQFINEFRVANFIEQMKTHPEMKKTYTLEHLASQSGFKSKSTFIRAFKKQTGITPAVFMQNLSKSY